MTILKVNMSARKVVSTLVATVFCRYLSNAFLTSAMPSELVVLIYRRI